MSPGIENVGGKTLWLRAADLDAGTRVPLWVDRSGAGEAWAVLEVDRPGDWAFGRVVHFGKRLRCGPVTVRTIELSRRFGEHLAKRYGRP